MTRATRIALGIGASLFALAIVVVGFAWWVIDTRPGSRFAVATAARLTDRKLQVERIEGTLARGVTLQRLRWSDPQGGVEVHVGEARVVASLRELWRRRAHVRSVRVADVTVTLGDSSRPEEPRRSLEPPLDIVLDDAVVERVRIVRAGATPIVVDRGTLAGRWTSREFAIERLDVRGPQGFVRVAGAAAVAGDHAGTARGAFGWRQGEWNFSGTLGLASRAGHAALHVQLRTPLVASIDAQMRQTDAMPWTMRVVVPAFDPKRFVADTSFARVALDLTGHGDRADADWRIEAQLDERHLTIAPARVAWRDPVLSLDALTLRIDDQPGSFDAHGTIRFGTDAPTPWHADLSVAWRDVELPREWVGQPLQTRGRLAVRGHPAAYSATGRFVAGPRDELANFDLVAKGSTQRVVLERLHVVQRLGRLEATGEIGLGERLAWRIEARARRFDPGVLLPQWPGRLAFAVDSSGEQRAAGLAATLRLTDLSGTLRQRAVAGRADLELRPDRSLVGDVDLRSGRSSVRFEGRSDANTSQRRARGASANDVAVSGRLRFDVATLADWLPDARGAVTGDLRLRGRWPAIAVDGTARGSNLRYADRSLAQFDLRTALASVWRPRGEASIQARGLEVGGLSFAALSLALNGDERSHAFELRARGEPLTLQLRAAGTFDGADWRGAIERLRLEAQRVPAVRLVDPAGVTLVAGRVTLDDACLAGGDFRICVAASGAATGEATLRYSLRAVPLALLRSVGTPDLPVVIDGTLDGEGDVRRDASGEFYGSAELRSNGGAIARADDPEFTLARIDDLRVGAQLLGRSARIRAGVRLVEGGAIDAAATLSDLDQPAIGVNGDVRATLDDLAIVELFTAQIANVSGRASAQARVAGTMRGTTPDVAITGEASIAAFNAEIPRTGTSLRDGELRLVSRERTFDLRGAVHAGDGRLDLRGTLAPAGEPRVTVSGANALLADIPGARVIASPDLEITRVAKRIVVKGRVDVPRAKIDLAKLPVTGTTRASPDVVVIDAPPRAAEAELPIAADVAVSLGEDVAVVGFGLDATVTGRLDVVERPGAATRGSGTLRLAGKYAAYGQKLTLTQASLLFANSPLDDPRLQITAQREDLDDVKPGLRIAGTAQQPVVSVFSDPVMADADALSYLVTGRPLQSVGTGTEGDLVQSAAQSLGSAAGNLAAKSVGRRLGVDQFGVEKDEGIGGDAFTIGKYLSPRLFLSYGVGLFTPGETVTLRYRLSNETRIEASRTGEQTRASLEYRVEK